jgi:hypothetical protein
VTDIQDFLRYAHDHSWQLDDHQHATLAEWARRLELRLCELSDQDIRRDCAFCGRERSPVDDNHADHCAYWALFPQGNT